MMEMPKWTSIGLIAFILILVCSSFFYSYVYASSSINEWTMFRHNPERSGYTISNATADVIKTLWISETGFSVDSSPAVAFGRIFVGCRSGNVYCFDAQNGEKLWSTQTGSIIFSSPAVINDCVYIGVKDGSVRCLNASTGNPVWESTLGGSVGWSSPTIVGGLLYIGSWDHNVYCLNASNGDKLWSFTTESPVDSSPAIADGIVYVGSDDTNVYALNASTGNKIWRYKTGGIVRSSPSVYQNSVYVGSSDGYVYALDASAGSLNWKYSTKNSVFSSPAVVDGYVYVGSNDNNVYCFDASTGEKIWSYSTRFWVRSSPAVADNHVYVGSEDGDIYCLNAFTGAKIWSYQTVDAVISSPAITDGNLYVGSSFGGVYALGNQEVADFPPLQPQTARWSVIVFNILASVVAVAITISIVLYVHYSIRLKPNVKAERALDNSFTDRFKTLVSGHADALCLMVILVFSVVLFLNLGNEPLWIHDEQTYSQWAFNMINKGDYLTPWAFGTEALWIGKPPLMMWLMSLSYQIFGVTNFATRFWSPIFATLSFVLIFYLGKESYNRYVGLLSALVLGTFTTFFVFARHAMTDVPFVFFMLSSLYFLLLGEKKENNNANRFAAISGIFFGLALMTRQVAALLIPVIFFVYFVVTQKSVRFLFTKRFALFLGAGFLIFAPWFIYMIIRFGEDFWYLYFMYHGVMRSVTVIEGQSGSFLYYFTYLIAEENLFWITLLPFATVFSVYYAVIRHLKEDTLLLVWIAVVLLVFSVAQTKLYWYILPVFPAFAITISIFLFRSFKRIWLFVHNPRRIEKDN